MEPDWSDFRVLIALSEAGSVAGAARLLGVDASTVSRRLATLEDAVGATLVIRGGREFAITADGRSVLAAAHEMADATARASNAIRAGKQEVAGLVRLSCIAAFTPVLADLLPIVKARHPALDLAILVSNRPVDLMRGEADIGLRLFRPVEPDVVFRQTSDCGWGVYAAKSYAAAKGLPASPDELRHHQVVLYDEKLNHLPGPDWFERHAGGFGSHIRVDSSTTATDIIASGAGIGVTTCLQGDGEPWLVRVFPEPIAFQPCYIVYHESLRGSARIRAMADLLAEFLKSMEARVSGRGFPHPAQPAGGADDRLQRGMSLRLIHKNRADG